MADSQDTFASAGRKTAEANNESRPAGVLPDRARPHALQVEKAVLGAMIREPESCIDLAIEQFNRTDVFYMPAHREIYRVLLELQQKKDNGVDAISLAQQLREEGKLDAVGGEIYIAELMDSIATTVNLESWCQTLVKYASI